MFSSRIASPIYVSPFACAFFRFHFRVLHESLYGYYPTSESINVENGLLNPNHTTAIRSPVAAVATAATTPGNLDADLAMALRISEQDQQQLQEDLKREQEMLEEVLRLSLQEK